MTPAQWARALSAAGRAVDKLSNTALATDVVSTALLALQMECERVAAEEDRAAQPSADEVAELHRLTQLVAALGVLLAPGDLLGVCGVCDHECVSRGMFGVGWTHVGGAVPGTHSPAPTRQYRKQADGKIERAL